VKEETMAIYSVQKPSNKVSNISKGTDSGSLKRLLQGNQNSPGQPLFLLLRAFLALGEQNFQDAINFCRAALLKPGYCPELYVNLCKVYSKAGQRKRLETLLEGLTMTKEINYSCKRRRGCRRKPLFAFLSAIISE
jgi:hypothetical protein